jgi:hypothetical protein
MRSISKVLRNAGLTGNDYQEELTEFLRNYRATPHTTTGIPPADLLFQEAKTTRLPAHTPTTTTTERRETAIKNEEAAKSRMKAYNDEKRKAKPSSIKIGDTVYLKNEQRHFKSDPLFEPEPYLVVDLKGTMATIRRRERELARHVSLLKLAIEPSFWLVDRPPTEQAHAPAHGQLEQDLINFEEQREEPHDGDNNDNGSSGNNNTDNSDSNVNNSASSDEEPESKASAGSEEEAREEDQLLRRSRRKRTAPERLGFGPQPAGKAGSRGNAPQQQQPTDENLIEFEPEPLDFSFF